ncbi:hypothetical protein ACP179_19850 [Xenorhabdus stockiae]
MRKQDELSLVIGGKAIYGWDSVRVTRGIERLAVEENIRFDRN